MSKNYRKENL